MVKFCRVFLIIVVMAFFSGCASDGTMVNPFSSNDSAPASPYYYNEFTDLPIPNEMSEVASESVISSTPSGVRTGIQRFTGRVEAVSLINAMRRNMLSQGWTLRSLFRAKETILIYEKGDRICSLYITDGVLKASMRVFMSELLQGDAIDSEVLSYGSSSAAPSTPQAKLAE